MLFSHEQTSRYIHAKKKKKISVGMYRYICPALSHFKPFFSHKSAIHFPVIGKFNSTHKKHILYKLEMMQITRNWSSHRRLVMEQQIEANSPGSLTEVLVLKTFQTCKHSGFFMKLLIFLNLQITHAVNKILTNK